MQVDFYILESSAPGDVQRVACRLADKAWQLGHRVFIHTDSTDAARKMDELLWTFRQDSFVPHAVAGSSADGGSEPVLVGDGCAPTDTRDVLINLTDDVPLFIEGSARIAEIIGGDPAARNLGRARYRAYRDRGYDIKQHNL